MLDDGPLDDGPLDDGPLDEGPSGLSSFGPDVRLAAGLVAGGDLRGSFGLVLGLVAGGALRGSVGLGLVAGGGVGEDFGSQYVS